MLKSGSLAALLTLFLEPFWTLFGTLSCHIAFFVILLVHLCEVRFFIDCGVDSGMADMRSDRARSVGSHVHPFTIWTQKGHQKMSFCRYLGTQIHHCVPKELPEAFQEASKKHN